MSQTYHLVHENLEQLPDGSWEARYPNLTLKFSEMPAWARTTEEINRTLDRATDPISLRHDFDEIYRLASADDFKEDRRHSSAAKYIQEIEQPETLNLLKAMYTLRLEDEHRSAAGCPTTLGLCNQIRIYNSVINKIEDRLAELSV